MTTLQSIQSFVSQKKIAVAGVSRKKQKFGNTIYSELKKKGFDVYPVNPNMDEFQGSICYRSLGNLPDDVTALVINTKNESALRLIKDARQKGIKNIWLQQGSLDKKTISSVMEPDLNIVANQCILMHAGEVTGVHAFHRWINKAFGAFPK